MLAADSPSSEMRLTFPSNGSIVDWDQLGHVPMHVRVRVKNVPTSSVLCMEILRFPSVWGTTSGDIKTCIRVAPGRFAVLFFNNFSAHARGERRGLDQIGG